MSTTEAQIQLYICHAFRADEDYVRVLEYLDGARRLAYRLVSDPMAPHVGGRETEREVWRTQIQNAEIVVAPSALADAESEAVDFQVRFARSAGKPVLVMRRFGSVLPPPLPLSRQAAAVVDWNERSLADALRHHARGDTGSRWDTIDFTLD
jgi:hypothetical protein